MHLAELKREVDALKEHADGLTKKVTSLEKRVSLIEKMLIKEMGVDPLDYGFQEAGA